MSERRSGASTVIKRSIAIAGHRTSVSIEDAFWTKLVGIASAKNLSLPALVAAIDRDRGGSNLSSAIRVFVLEEICGPGTSRGEASPLNETCRVA